MLAVREPVTLDVTEVLPVTDADNERVGEREADTDNEGLDVTVPDREGDAAGDADCGKNMSVSGGNLASNPARTPTCPCSFHPKHDKDASLADITQPCANPAKN
jgi:hypothetical protein